MMTSTESSKRRVPIALDTSILSDIAIAAACIPKSKTEDRKAIDALLDLARQDLVELGIACTGAAMEVLRAGDLKRQVLELLHKWPVVVPLSAVQ